MSYPLLQFVASPDTSATVRFDFNQGTTGVDGSTEVLQDGFSLGSPTLQGDPDGIGTEYGFRELSIPLRINGTTTSAPALFATLARELGRQTNWLRFQATSTSPSYWFKTYRSAPEPLDWEQFRNLPAGTVAKWYVDLKLDADSHARGATVTIGPVTIHNDPAVPKTPISAPVVNTPTTATTGGTLAAGTYFYVVTALTSAGQSTISNRVSRVTTGSTSTVTVTWSAVTGATGYSIYRSTTSGSEKFRASVGAVVTYTDTGAATTATAFPTVNTTAGNPVSYPLPTILGDAPAPLTATLYPSRDVRGRMLVSTCSIPSEGSAVAPYVWQAENFQAGTGTTFTSDSNYSNGQKAVVTFGTPTLASRISGGFSSSGSGLGFAPPIGTYTVYVRVGRSDTTSRFKLSTGVSPAIGVDPATWLGGVTVDGTSNDNTWATWVAVSDVSLPPSAAAELPAGVIRGYSESLVLHVGAERLSGTGSLWIDAVMAVPVEVGGNSATTLTMETDQRSVGYPNNSVVVDGDVEAAIIGRGSFTSIYRPPLLRGSFPVVLPGTGNLLTVLQHTDTTALADNVLLFSNDDIVTASTVVDLSYRPRWLYLAAS